MVIGNREPVGVELKWCWEKGTFPNCLWDVLKLASALHSGSLTAGYLLVGGSEHLFASGELGSEPFRGGSWRLETHELFTDPEPAAWFRTWGNEVISRPRRVPAGVRTVFVCGETATVRDGGFTVALARVEIEDDRTLLISEDGRVEQPLRP